MSRQRRGRRITRSDENEFLAAFGTPAERDFDPNRHSIFQDEDDAQEAALENSRGTRET